MGKMLFKWAALFILLLLLAFLVPSGALIAPAFAEEQTVPPAEEELPVFVPVSLPDLAQPLPPAGQAPYAPHEAGFSADGLSYRDDSLSVSVYKTRAYGTPITVVYIQIADASQLRTEQAKFYPSPAVARTDVLARRANAVVACNADYFIYHHSGIIYREGKLLRDSPDAAYDALVIDSNGDFHLIAPLTPEGFAAIAEPIVASFCFGPALVIDGQIHEDVGREETFTQRMGIAQCGKLSYLLAATDGAEEKDSKGLSIPQFAQLMKDLGAINAYNLDGGASTCIIFNGQKINGQKAAKIRAVGDIVYFSTAIPHP